MATMTTQEIADSINAAGETYYGCKAKASNGRTYFGRDYVTVETTGRIHADKEGKARAQTIGNSAVELVKRHASKEFA